MANKVKSVAQTVSTSATKSWRTTVLGVISGLAVILPQLQALFDADPETAFNIETVIAGLSLMGIGALARDNVVSSETARAVKLLAIGALVVFLVGCKQYTAADWAFLNAADKYHDAVGGPFIQYVNEDSNLTAVQVESRVKAHEIFGEAIEARRETMLQTSSPTD